MTLDARTLGEQILDVECHRPPAGNPHNVTKQQIGMNGAALKQVLARFARLAGFTAERAKPKTQLSPMAKWPFETALTRSIAAKAEAEAAESECITENLILALANAINADIMVQESMTSGCSCAHVIDVLLDAAPKRKRVIWRPLVVELS
jgi:hypothetical protein